MFVEWQWLHMFAATAGVEGGKERGERVFALRIGLRIHDVGTNTSSEQLRGRLAFSPARLNQLFRKTAWLKWAGCEVVPKFESERANGLGTWHRGFMEEVEMRGPYRRWKNALAEMGPDVTGSY